MLTMFRSARFLLSGSSGCFHHYSHSSSLFRLMSSSTEEVFDGFVLPPKLNGAQGKEERNFTFLTITERWPKIIGKVVDHFHCNRRKFMEEYGEDADSDVKSVIHELSEMRYRLQTNKPLEDIIPHSELWNQTLEELRNKYGADKVTWFDSDWLYVECYLYRRLFAFLCKTKYLQKYDMFANQKKECFTQHLSQIKSTTEYVLEHATDKSNHLEKTLELLIKVSLWGNRADLSMSGGETVTHAKSSLDAVRDCDKYILCDDLKRAMKEHLLCLKPNHEGKRRLDIVLDNSGLELMSDLWLSEFLLAANLVDVVHLHGKDIPWFVSDVTQSDLNWTMQQLEKEGGVLLKFYNKLKLFFDKNQIVYSSDCFWTFPHAYFEMSRVAPHLYTELQKSSFIIFKGDLNYRKLVGDRDWEYITPFRIALRGFDPAPFLALRTLKAETVCGLGESALSQLREKFGEKKEWLTSGEYAVIQLNPHTLLREKDE